MARSFPPGAVVFGRGQQTPGEWIVREGRVELSVGDLRGMPATGKRISVEAVDIGRIENGQAQERWGGLGMYSMLAQLGVIPAPQRG